MKKFLSILTTAIITMSLMSFCVTAQEEKNVIASFKGQNGTWEYFEKSESSILPFATDNEFATFSIPIGPSTYRDISPNKLILSGNEDAIGIEFKSFTPGSAVPYFNIMNVTDNTWVEDEWMGGIHMATTGTVLYTFDSSYLVAHAGDKFAVKMYTKYYEATTTLRTFTTTK